MLGNIHNSILATQGAQRSPTCAMLHTGSFKDGDFDKAIIGIANVRSTITPCNVWES